MTKVKSKDEQDMFYVGVKNPTELRRDILETSRLALQTLHSYEKFKSIKQRKLELTGQVRDLVKDLTKNVKKLRSSLPKLPQVAAKSIPKKSKNIIVSKTNDKTVSNKLTSSIDKSEIPSDIEKLEHELAAIERQLGSLS